MIGCTGSITISGRDSFKKVAKKTQRAKTNRFKMKDIRESVDTTPLPNIDSKKSERAVSNAPQSSKV